VKGIEERYGKRRAFPGLSDQGSASPVNRSRTKVVSNLSGSTRRASNGWNE